MLNEDEEDEDFMPDPFVDLIDEHHRLLIESLIAKPAAAEESEVKQEGDQQAVENRNNDTKMKTTLNEAEDDEEITLVD